MESSEQVVSLLILSGPREITYAELRRRSGKSTGVMWRDSKLASCRQRSCLRPPCEKLVLKVAGHLLSLAETERLRDVFTGANKGCHCIHFGGKFDSKVEIPLVEV